MKILIVEDEPALAEIMQRFLQKERYVVETANNYRKASEKIAGYDYDCILLEVV